MGVEDIELDSSQIQRLLELRGGCHCHTLRFPPCHNCTDPLTQEEADILGFCPQSLLPCAFVCRDSLGVALTEGKEYEIKFVDQTFVEVVGDDGKSDLYFADRFVENR